MSSAYSLSSSPSGSPKKPVQASPTSNHSPSQLAVDKPSRQPDSSGDQANIPTPWRWTIIYSDKTTVTSDEMEWEKAPSKKVVVVIQYFQETYKCWIKGRHETLHYRTVWSSPYDLYWMADGMISAGFVGEVPRGINPKEGVFISDNEFQEIFNNAYGLEL